MSDPGGDAAQPPRRPARPKPPDPTEDEAWVQELGPRAPSHRARAVLSLMVLAAVVISAVLACALALDL
ncbi:MAG TPA: hypothetical protein VK028_06210, partial [Micromonosporaceae bacterium]|nr:hypothetical protein [Micromonosporaceae bacterium]